MCRRGAAKILAWLAGFDARGWQERWTVAAGDDMVCSANWWPPTPALAAVPSESGMSFCAV